MVKKYILLIIFLSAISIISVSLYFILSKKEDYNNDKIGINTYAGLGNQIFQIAFIYTLSRKNNMDYVAVYSNNNSHTNINSKYYSTIFKNFNTTNQRNIKFTNNYNLSDDKFSIFMPEIFNIHKDTFFKGYYQNEKYFIDF